MPLFDMKSTKTAYIVAGGGGKEDYGIQNGITVVMKRDEKQFFYKTEDIIREIEVLNDEECKNEVQINHVTEKDQKTENTINKLSRKEQEHETDRKLLDRIKQKNPEMTKNGVNLLIAAIGVENFYLIKFNGSFHLLSKTKKTVKKVYLGEFLVILEKGGRLSAFHDVKNSPALKFEEFEGKSEGMVYKMVKRDRKVVLTGENGQKYAKIGGISTFYVKNGEIHSVLSEGGKSRFEINGEIREVEGKIGKIAYNGSFLVFYATIPTGSVLFVGDNKFNLPKITDMAVNRDIVAVATVYGDIYIYKNGLKINRINVSDLPITGLAIENEIVHFSVLNGVVSSVSISKKMSVSTFILIALLIIFIAMGIKYVRK
ncbi:hypothetical protein NUSPORA_02256 [Nucleospora cyclopteri]